MGGKQSGELTVDYHARCLAPAQATLLLVAKGGRAVAGSTLAFKLVGRTANFKPQVEIISIAAVTVVCVYTLHSG